MRVEPARLVELARATDEALVRLEEAWLDAAVELREACVGLGEATGAIVVQSSYGAAVDAADQAVGSLVHALESGVEAVLGAAGDAIAADEVVAAQLWHAAGSPEALG